MAVDSSGYGSTNNNSGASPIVAQVINAANSQFGSDGSDHEKVQVHNELMICERAHRGLTAYFCRVFWLVTPCPISSLGTHDRYGSSAASSRLQLESVNQFTHTSHERLTTDGDALASFAANVKLFQPKIVAEN
jgi:hypothetical protein